MAAMANPANAKTKYIFDETINHKEGLYVREHLGTHAPIHINQANDQISTNHINTKSVSSSQFQIQGQQQWQMNSNTSVNQTNQSTQFATWTQPWDEYSQEIP